MRIAIVDADLDAQAILRSLLQRQGHVCHTFHSGEALLQALRRGSFDLLVLDWPCPGMPTAELTGAVRELQDLHLPVLFVSHHSDEESVVAALACGGDDFLTKPLRPAEFLARVNALLRRTYSDRLANRIDFPPYTFLPETRSLRFRDEAIILKNMEYELALFMFQSAGRLLSRDHIQEMVWGQTDDVPSRTIDTHVSRLRTKLHLQAENGYVLQAVYGFGYRLDVLDRSPAGIAF